jgi:excisionase family DNA binding protein
MDNAPAFPQEPEPLLHTVDETCFLLRLSRASIYELMKESKVRFLYLHGRRRIPRSEIIRLIDEGLA